MTKAKTNIEINSEYYQEIEKIVGQSSQFQTVSEYVNFVLKEMLFGFSDSGRIARIMQRRWTGTY